MGQGFFRANISAYKRSAVFSIVQRKGFAAFDRDEVKALIDKATRVLPDIEKMKVLLKLQKQTEAYIEVEKYTDADIEDIDKKIKAISEQLKAYPNYLACLEQLAETKEMSVQEVVGNKVELTEKINVCKEYLRAKADLERIKSQCTTKLRNPESELEELDTKVQELKQEQAVISKAIQDYQLFESLTLRYTKDKTDQQAKLTALEPKLQKRYLLEILEKAYGSKGIRTYAVQSIGSKIEENLNYYAPTIFAENFTFTVVCSEQGMSITVDRNNGFVSDVRNLSGAESNSFRLLFLLAILPLIPSNRRCNFLLLDEPMAHAEGRWKSLFFEKYLPLLSEAVSCIYITTPHPEDIVDGLPVVKIVKQNGTSTIILEN